jgi:hypothetical protein
VSGVAYPGMGDVEPGGFTPRPDRLQVVTTKYFHTEHEPIWTTAVYPENTGRVVFLNPTVAMFEFDLFHIHRGAILVRPLWVAWAPSAFEGGRNHEKAFYMEFKPPKKGETAWTRLIQDMLEIP